MTSSPPPPSQNRQMEEDIDTELEGLKRGYARAFARVRARGGRIA